MCRANLEVVNFKERPTNNDKIVRSSHYPIFKKHVQNILTVCQELPPCYMPYIIPFNFFKINFIYLFIYLWLHWVFVAVHGLLIAVASLVAEHGLQARGLRQLWLAGSRAQARQLWHTGFVAPQHVGSSRTRARTRVPCIGRRILNHCTTREVPNYNLIRLRNQEDFEHSVLDSSLHVFSFTKASPLIQSPLSQNNDAMY